MSLDRRQVFRAVAALGVGSATFQRALAAEVSRTADSNDDPKADPAKPVEITAEMVKNAEWIAGLTLTDDERKQVAAELAGKSRLLAAARSVKLAKDIPPAFQFNPAPGLAPSAVRGTVTPPTLDTKKPAADDDLAFASVAELAHLIRTKQVSSVELTKLSLARLKKYDPALFCVVELTEEIALKAAKAADDATAAGKVGGPLQGIPWGAKDLVSYPGTKTTWGAAHFKEQKFDVRAGVAKRLDDAGAVLAAKLSLGALAMDDVWFGGQTRNPWNPKQGSSGSSAGPASAVSAGLVPFAIGSETQGSIVSPSTRCGVTGLRPTFGRVSRAGCMALSWTMDKIGPIARSVEDCALVFAAIHGRDPDDPTTVDQPFNWPGKAKLGELTVGYIESRKQVVDRDELKVLKKLGVKLVPVALPNILPVRAIGEVLDVECAAAFDDLTRTGVKDGYGKLWPPTFRYGQFVTAVEYIRASRLRTLLVRQMAEVMAKCDLFVHGPFEGLQLLNLTGHPTVCLPNGLVKSGDVEVPKSITFTGRLYGETDLLAVAHAYQKETGFHLRRPPMDKLLPEKK